MAINTVPRGVVKHRFRRFASLQSCAEWQRSLPAVHFASRHWKGVKETFLPPLTPTFILHSRHAFGRHIKKREPGAIGCCFFFFYFFSFFSNDDGITRRGHRNVPSACASLVIMEFADCCCSCLVCTAESTASMQPGNVPSH